MHVVKFLVDTMACKRYTVSEAFDRIVNLHSDDSGDESDTSSNEADNVCGDSSDSNSDDEESACPLPCERQTMMAESASTEGKDKTIWHYLYGHSPLGHNVFTARKGVTNYCRNILTPVDAWRLLMDEGCIWYILQCTSEQASELVLEWTLSEE